MKRSQPVSSVGSTGSNQLMGVSSKSQAANSQSSHQVVATGPQTLQNWPNVNADPARWSHDAFQQTVKFGDGARDCDYSDKKLYFKIAAKQVATNNEGTDKSSPAKTLVPCTFALRSPPIPRSCILHRTTVIRLLTASILPKHNPEGIYKFIEARLANLKLRIYVCSLPDGPNYRKGPCFLLMTRNVSQKSFIKFFIASHCIKQRREDSFRYHEADVLCYCSSYLESRQCAGCRWERMSTLKY
jgi:hypothetical protein